jgi:AcrR family transcriptional regulator
LTEAAAKTRRRDADATKQAIQDAAGACFGKAGYDQVGLREIAALAGVDVALVGRYFGSKEELFAAWIEEGPRPPPAYPDDRRSFGEWIVRKILGKERDLTRMLAMHNSVTNPRAAEIVRRALERRTIKPLGKWIGGADGELRASLILAHLTGFSVMRDIIGVEALGRADRERLVKRLGRAVQSYIDD